MDVYVVLSGAEVHAAYTAPERAASEAKGLLHDPMPEETTWRGHQLWYRYGHRGRWSRSGISIQKVTVG